MRTTIPLGVNTSDFATSPEQRKAWRERLDIPDDAVVVLYVGRFNTKAKMNPALMAMALERAARRTCAATGSAPIPPTTRSSSPSPTGRSSST